MSLSIYGFILILGNLAQSLATPPTSPTLVTLDFKNQTISQIIRALDTRIGGGLELSGANDQNPNDPRHTIESTAAIPLWDALDRLSKVSSLQRSVSGSGLLGNPRPKVQFQRVYPPAEADQSPALYVGPFRLGAVTTHERFEQVFLMPRPIQSYVSTTPAFYAEIPLMAEPGLLYITLGPSKTSEAVDDRGQSLLDPNAAYNETKFKEWRGDAREPRSVIVPLVRPKESSKTIVKLKGAIPMEVARRPLNPTSRVKLVEAVGKTIREGDLIVTIKEFKTSVEGQTSFKIQIKLDGERGRPSPTSRSLRDERLWMVAYQQLAVVDASGKPMNLGGGGGPNNQGELNLDYSYSIDPAEAKGVDSTTLLIYRADWVAWDLPFEIKDLPLP